MKFDKLLGILFGKLGIFILIFAVLLIPLLSTACSLEDVLCFVFCGCVTPTTCFELCSGASEATCNGITECSDCLCDTLVRNPYNACMDCVNSGLSSACDSFVSCTSGDCTSCAAAKKQEYLCGECVTYQFDPIEINGTYFCTECGSSNVYPIDY